LPFSCSLLRSYARPVMFHALLDGGAYPGSAVLSTHGYSRGAPGRPRRYSAVLLFENRFDSDGGVWCVGAARLSEYP
jgi:hypothetical protein